MCFHPIYPERQSFVDVPAGITQEEGQIGFIHVPSAVLTFSFIAKRIQPSPSSIDRERNLCTHEINALHTRQTRKTNQAMIDDHHSPGLTSFWAFERHIISPAYFITASGDDVLGDS